MRHCFICGATRYVQVHHIDSDHSNNVEQNLVDLCAVCHSYVTHPPRPEEMDFIYERFGTPMRALKLCILCGAAGAETTDFGIALDCYMHPEKYFGVAP